MSTKLLLYFAAHEHALYEATGGGLTLDGRFSPDDQGLEDFRARLRGRKGALVYILADLAGEDFHEDQIPYLRGGDRQAVIQRRLVQRYRDTRLAAALPLGYTAGERRNERLLLASFTNTQQFTPWLDAVVQTGARLSGVYSTGLLAPALAAKLGVRSGRALVVTADSAGLRQSFVEDGKLRFSRLERTGDMAAEALAAFVHAETLRLVQYLSTLRALPREGAPIQAVVVAPAGQRAAFEKVLVSDVRLAFITLDAEEALRKVGIKRPPAGAASEQLYLQLAAKQAPKEQFARGEDRRAFFLWRLQRVISGVGIATLAACLLVAGYQWIMLFGLRGQVEEQRRDAVAATQQYERITASFPVTQTTTDNLKATVVEFTRIAAQSASPEPALVYLSQVVEKFPQIEIESVQWKVGRPDDRADAAPTSSKPPAAAPADAKAAPSGETLQLLEVSGRVNAIKRSEYRAITGQVQRFAEALRTDPAWRIVRTQLPFDVTSEGTLSGDIGSAEGSDAPKFTITVGRALK
jgi:hypothetical protein